MVDDEKVLEEEEEAQKSELEEVGRHPPHRERSTVHS